MRSSGISQRAAEIGVAAGFLGVGAVMMLDTYQLGAGWAKEGPQSGYFPFRIGAIICLASIAVIVQALRSKNKDAVFVTYARLRHVMLVLLPTLVYIGAIHFVGIYVASAVFIAGFMRVMDKYSWLKTLAVSVGLNAIFFWLFEVQFLVPLPKGPIEAYFGY
jgi:hypothetical protein